MVSKLELIEITEIRLKNEVPPPHGVVGPSSLAISLRLSEDFFSVVRCDHTLVGCQAKLATMLDRKQLVVWIMLKGLKVYTTK